ncbi:MAG: DUF6362 family protein [Bdellovibrionales bacterium]
MSKGKKHNVKDVADRIEQAANTMKKLPKVKVQGYFNAWPTIVREAMEAYGWEDNHMRPSPPSAKHITEMEEVMIWLLWLEREEVRLIWMRAEGVRWKRLSLELGWSVRKLQYDWKIGLMKIVHRLNNPNEKIQLPYKRYIRNG